MWVLFTLGPENFGFISWLTIYCDHISSQIWECTGRTSISSHYSVIIIYSSHMLPLIANLVAVTSRKTLRLTVSSYLFNIEFVWLYCNTMIWNWNDRWYMIGELSELTICHSFLSILSSLLPTIKCALFPRISNSSVRTGHAQVHETRCRWFNHTCSGAKVRWIICKLY